MKTSIVLIKVDNDNARKVCELLENQHLTYGQLENQLSENGVEIGEFMVMGMSSFMDAVNDQELDILTEFFISYVTII